MCLILFGDRIRPWVAESGFAAPPVRDAFPTLDALIRYQLCIFTVTTAVVLRINLCYKYKLAR